VARRVRNCLRYLDPVFVLAGVLPLNLGWMHKLAADGNFERGQAVVMEVGQ
jgi:hypothetical protein